MIIGFSGVYFTGEFFKYLETSDETLYSAAPATSVDSTYWDQLMFWIHMNKGIVMLACIVFVEWPKGIVEDLFHKYFDEMLTKIREAQKMMIYKKYMKVSGASNKTISKGKFHRVFHGSIHAFWGLFWQGAEVVQACFVLIFCSTTLFERVGYSFLIMPLFIAAKMIFDKTTRRWRESSHIFEHRVSDKRRNELDMSLRNIKSVKLYAW